MEAFFLDELPRTLVQAPMLFLKAEGSLAFSADGDAFTVRLGNPDTPIERVFDENASVRLRFQPRAFEAFLEGRFLGCEIEGNVEVFQVFGLLLQVCAQAAGNNSDTVWR